MVMDTMRAPCATQRTGDLLLYRLEQLYDESRQDDGRRRGGKTFGNTVVIWDLHTRKPKKFDVPGAPLKKLCLGLALNYCFTTTALTSKVWLIYEDETGEWQAKAVADIGGQQDTPASRYLHLGG